MEEDGQQLPGGKASMPLEWMSWVLVAAPWWSLSAPSSVHCFVPHKLCFCDSVLVLGCCARRPMQFFLDMFLWPEGVHGELRVEPFFKHRRPLFFSAFEFACSFSAGRGGEGGERTCSVAVAKWGWCLFSSCFAVVLSRGTGRLLARRT